jgi:signal transduction histidine kinase
MAGVRKSRIGAFKRTRWVVGGGGLLLVSVMYTRFDERATQRRLGAASDAGHVSEREFLLGLGHDLRTPLNAVLGFAQLLEVDNLTESQTDSVGQILKGGRRMLSLINEALNP